MREGEGAAAAGAVPNDALEKEEGGAAAAAAAAGEPEGRARWSSPIEFLLVLCGYAIGIGNLWRFPYLVGKYGGGSFLVAYVLALLLVALPLFVMELAIGQRFQSSALECYRKMAPAFVGMAYAQFLAVFFLSAYYNVLLAYAVFYAAQSFRSPLPWTKWVSEDKEDDDDGRCAGGDDDDDLQCFESSERYFFAKVLRRSAGSSSMGTSEGWELHLPLVLAFIASWLVVYLCLRKGIKGTGKVAYITVSLPFLLLTALFIRVLTLPGAGKGVAYYLTPRLSVLWDQPEVWGVACSQILFSLSPGMGSAIALASYNAPNHDVVRDALVVASLNSVFSILGGFVIFAVIGNMAYKSDGEETVEDIASSSGVGLAFVVFARGLAQMPLPQLWSAAFFLMLYNLGLGSSFAWVETLNTSVVDLARGAKLNTTPQGRFFMDNVCGFVCGSLCLLGLVFCTRSGSYWLEVVDHYCATYILLVCALVESIMIGHVYGASVFVEDVRRMTGRKLSVFWIYSPKYIIPVLVSVLLCATLYADIFTSDFSSEYPPWALVVGSLSAIIPLACIPCVALAYHFRRESPEGPRRRFSVLWRPMDPTKTLKSDTTTTSALHSLSCYFHGQ